MTFGNVLLDKHTAVSHLGTIHNSYSDREKDSNHQKDQTDELRPSIASAANLEDYLKKR